MQPKLLRGSEILREPWTGEVVGKLHVYEISQTQLADKMNLNRSFLNQVLCGCKKLVNAEERCNTAISELIKERGLETHAENKAR